MSGEAAAALRAHAAAHPIRSDLNRLAKLAGPVVVARLGVMTMGLSDIIVVGHYSAVQLGFLALGWAIASAFLGSAMGLLSGVQVMTSRAIGERNPSGAGAALRRGLSYGLCFALSSAAASWLEGLGRMTPPMVLMWVANILNLGVDLVVVPGRFGLHPMGAIGATLATFSARTFLALATLAYIALMPDARRLGVFTKPPRDRALEREQRRVGYGAAASNFFEMSAFSSMNVIAGWISPLTVAAWAVALNVLALVFMVPAGLSTATAVMVARCYGAGDTVGLKRAAMVGFAVTAAFGIAIGVVDWPSALTVASLYTTDVQTVALAAGALALCCAFFAPDGLQVVVAQALRARGDVVAPTLTHLASYIFVMLPLAYVLAIPLKWGLTGIVASVILAGYLSAGLLLGRFWFLGRRD
jgi:MATE family multidrug resistance protein